MQRSLLAATAFVISALLGTMLLLLAVMAVALFPIFMQRTSGIAAVSGGLPLAVLLAIALASGLAGMLLTLRRVERRNR